MVWSGNRHSPSKRPLGTLALFPSICSHVKHRFHSILLCASQLTEQLYPWGPGCSAFSFGNAHCPQVLYCHPEGLVRWKVLRYSSQDVEGMVSEGYEAFAFFCCCSSQSTGPPWTSHFPFFPRKPTKAKVQVAKGQVPLTFYSHLLLVQGKEGMTGLTSQGVPGEPVLEPDLRLGPRVG